MTEKKPELSAAMKSKVEPKVFKKNPIIGTKFTIAISSAKGGVGKSTFATNLALALKQIGCKVGILDADIYGPSIPKMFGINEKPKSDGQKLDPIMKYDIQCMSIGFLADQQTPMIWRGPMVTSAIKTFTQKVNWKDLDFIIVDMPPGTGDVQMALARLLPQAEMMVVTTPAVSAQKVAVRVADMARRSHMPILGVIENMSYLENGNEKLYPFGKGGGEELSKNLGVEFIGSLPLYDSVSKYSEDGKLLEFGADNDFKFVEEMVNAINAIAPKKKPIDLKIN